MDFYMEIEILRGKEHIGGNIIKVTEGSTSILLDCGEALPPVGQPYVEDDFDMRCIGPMDAVFLSHHHGDHSGLLERLPAETALYASEATIHFMNTVDSYLDRPLRTGSRSVYPLTDLQTVLVGELSIKSIAVEHSADGAMMFLIGGRDKRILYTGDFKEADGLPIDGVDLLITEGTMLTRDDQAYADEDAVEQALRQLLQDTKGRVFVLQSSANLPRIRSVMNARNAISPVALSARPIMQDVFLKFTLEQTGHGELAAPYAFVWNGFDKNGSRAYDRIVREFCDYDAATSYKRIADFRNAIVFIRPTMLKMFQQLIHDGMDISRDALVFSQWRGYEAEPKTAALLNLFARHGVQPTYIHTSGHADKRAIGTLIAHIKPKKIACVHSEDANAIAMLVPQDTQIVQGDVISL